jgi:hypothetical protein
MPIYIEELNSEVTVLDGELPLTDAQLDRLVRLVLRRMEEQQRAARQTAESTRLRLRAAPPTPFSE